MNKAYDMFKAKTLEADDVVKRAEDMQVISSSFADGFHKAMWEAREIYMRLEDETEQLLTKKGQSDE